MFVAAVWAPNVRVRANNDRYQSCEKTNDSSLGSAIRVRVKHCVQCVSNRARLVITSIGKRHYKKKARRSYLQLNMNEI